MPSDLIAAAREAASRAPNVLPCTELQEILLPAYRPCPNLGGPCSNVVKWYPLAGHVPRGFIGATGSANEVELVLITAEPGDPLSDEMYDEQTPSAMLARTCSHAYGILAIAPTWRDRISSSTGTSVAC
jgi:hypothetical protein